MRRSVDKTIENNDSTARQVGLTIKQDQLDLRGMG
jgi:hypothetical protein